MEKENQEQEVKVEVIEEKKKKEKSYDWVWYALAGALIFASGFKHGGRQALKTADKGFDVLCDHDPTLREHVVNTMVDVEKKKWMSKK